MLAVCLSVTLPFPSSPEAENLMPSLVHAMVTEGASRQRVGEVALASDGLPPASLPPWEAQRTRVADHGHVAADALELGRRHPDDALVLGVGDAQVLAVNVHELELVGRDAVVVCGGPADRTTREMYG